MTDTLPPPVVKTVGEKMVRDEPKKRGKEALAAAIVQDILDNMATRNGMTNGIDPVVYENMREQWQDLVAKRIAEAPGGK